MPGNVTLNLVQIFVALVAVATVAAILVRRTRIPYTVGLVLLGLVFGLAARMVDPEFSLDVPGELILAVFLPGLVFESGYRLELPHLRRTMGAVFILAVPGVAVTAVVVGVVLNFATGLRFELGFIIGGMLAATDPPAVIAAIRRMRAPERLLTLIEAESLFNDGTAIVIFVAALAALTAGLGLVGGAISVIVTVAVSVLIGAVGGYACARLIERIDDHLIELSITLVLAYGTYLVADALQQSGIIATVVAAIVLGNQAREHGMSERSRAAIDTVWEFAAFLLTALLFLLIGLVIDATTLATALVPIGWGILAILAARAMIVYGFVGATSRLASARRLAADIPARWLHVVFAAGMRGAVSIALALSLPLSVPDRGLLIDVVFGVTLFTLVVQGLILDPIVSGSLGATAGETSAEPNPVP